MSSWSNGGSNAASISAAVNDVAGVAEGASVTIDVMANDGASAKTVYSVNQGSSRQATSDTTDRGATVSIVDGKIVYDSSTSQQFQTLAVGETMTDTFTYVVKLADGKTDEASVTVTVTGTNDGPVLGRDFFGPNRLTEVAGVTAGTGVHKDGGILLFSDVDLRDTHNVSSTLASATASKGGIPPATQAALNAAFTTEMQIDSARLPGGMISYRLNLADKLVDFLGAGDTLTLVYNLTVSDGHGGASTQTVTYVVTGTADALKVSAPVMSPVAEGGVSTVDALSGVSDGDAGTLSVVNLPSTLPAGLTYDAATHSFTFDSGSAAYDHLPAGQTQVVSVTYGVSDGATTLPRTLSWTVTGTNDAPLVSARLIGAGGEAGGVVTLDALAGAADVDDGATLSVVVPGTLPGGVTYDAATHSFSLDPANPAYNHLGAGQTTTVTVTFAISDGTVTTTQTATWTITGANDAPVVIAAVSAGSAEGAGLLTIDALAGASDVDDLTTLTVVDLPATLPAGVTYDAATHSFVLDASISAYNHLPAGQTQVVAISFGVSDGTVTTPQTLTWTVTGANDAPMVTAALASAASEGGVTTVDALGGASDIDDGAILSVANVPGTLPAGVTYDAAAHSFSLNASDTSFDHLGAGQTKTVTVSFGVSDGTVTTPQTVTWTVTGTNDAPVVAAALTSAAADGGAPSIVDALAGAADVDDNTTLRTVGLPEILPPGVTYDAATHSFRLDGSHPGYDHLPAGVTKVVSVSFGVSDGTAITPQTVTWTVTGANDAPAVVALTGAVAEGSAPSTVDALGGASDLDDGAVLKVVDVPAASALPAGVTYDPATHSFTLDSANAAYNHLPAGVTQQVVVSFGISDGTVTTPQTITWTVTGANDAPTVTAALTGAAAEGVAASVVDALSGAADLDDATILSVVDVPAISDLPPGVTYNVAAHSFSLDASNPAYNHLPAGVTQQVSVSFGVSDGTATTPQTVTWTVTGANDAPTVTALTATAAEGAVSTLSALAGVSDLDDGAVLAVVDVPAGLPVGVTYDADVKTFSLNTAAPAFDHLAVGESQTVTVSFGVSDGTATTPQSVSWTVIGTNDGPVLAAATGPIAVSEVTGATNGTAIDQSSVTLAFTDLDTNDTHTASYTAPTVVWSAGSTLPPTIQAVATTLNTALTLSLAESAGTGSVTAKLGIADSLVDALGAGQTLTVTYDVTLSDTHGGATIRSVTFVVSGANDAFTLGAPVDLTVTEDAPVQSVQLLAGAADPDASEVLSLVTKADGVTPDVTVSVVATGTTWTTPIAFTADKFGALSVDPNQFDGLQVGEQVKVTFGYTVTDSQGATAPATAQVTFTGVNDTPASGGDTLVDPSVDLYASAYTALANANATSAPISTNHTAYRQVAVADLNGDGALDVVATTADGLVVLRNDGAGGLALAHSFAVTNLAPVDVQIGDLNGDGLADMFLAIGTGTHLSFINNGGFGFTTIPWNSGTPSPSPYVGFGQANRVTLADFNGDGKLDVAITTTTDFSAQLANLGYPAIRVVMGDGAGRFEGPGTIYTLSETPPPAPDIRNTTLIRGFPADVGAADFNGDGSMDLFVVSGFDTSYIYSDDAPPQSPVVLLNNGSGTFTASQWLPATNAASVALGDINGDGKVDAVVGAVFTSTTGTPIGGSSQVWINDGVGQFSAGALLSNPTGPIGSLNRMESSPVGTVKLIDLDGDGDLDLVAAGSRNTTTWTNNGAGQFTLTNTLAAARDVALGDLDLKSINASKVFPLDVSRVLGNDTDVDGDNLTVTAVSGHSALGAKVTLAASVISYDPTYVESIQALGQDARLTDTFTYTISDGHGGFSTATVSLNVYGMGGARVGSSGADSITEPALGGLTVIGLGGADRLIGSNVADVLIGGTGDDTLTGRAGADHFVFAPGFGHDTVSDYVDGVDKLVFDTRVFANTADVLAHATQGAGFVQITDAAGNSVTLNGVTLTNLGAGDFLFS